MCACLYLERTEPLDKNDPWYVHFQQITVLGISITVLETAIERLPEGTDRYLLEKQKSLVEDYQIDTVIELCRLNSTTSY
jgi:hypothetical protein